MISFRVDVPGGRQRRNDAETKQALEAARRGPVFGRHPDLDGAQPRPLQALALAPLAVGRAERPARASFGQTTLHGLPIRDMSRVTRHNMRRTGSLSRLRRCTGPNALALSAIGGIFRDMVGYGRMKTRPEGHRKGGTEGPGAWRYLGDKVPPGVSSVTSAAGAH